MPVNRMARPSMVARSLLRWCVPLAMGCTGPCSIAQDVRAILDRYTALQAHEGAERASHFLDSIHRVQRTSDAELLTVVLRAGQLRRRGDIAQAYALIDSVAIGSLSAAGPVRYAHASELALILKSLHAYDKAESYALQAYHYAQAFDLGPYQVDALSLIAEMHRRRGAFDLAMARLIEAEKLAVSHGHAEQLCGVLNNRGGLAHSRGLHNEALGLFASARACALEHGLHSLALRSLSNLGAVHYQLDSLLQAVHCYEAAIAAADPLADGAFVAQVTGNLGLLFTEMEQYAKAEGLLRGALASRAAVNDSAGMMDVHLYLAQLLRTVGREREALGQAVIARDLASKAHATERLQQAEFLLYELEDAMGHCEEAMRHLIAQQAARLELDSLAFGETTLRLEVAYETEKKEQALIAFEALRSAERSERNWLLLVSGLLLGVAVLLYRNNMAQRRLRKQERSLHTREVSDLLKQQEINSLESMMKGQERERERVGRDLHDRIGSMLSSVKLQFSALEGRLTKLEDTQRSQYDKLTGLLDETVAEVRRISHDMVRGTLADFGLLRALQDLGEALTAPGKLRVEMSAFGMEDRLPPPFEVGVYRIVQECVSNVLRHAKATELTIQLTRSVHALNVLVEDNGTGFDTDQLKAGLGLRNIKERAAALGGTASIDSALGRGTTVSIDLPLA